MCFLVVAVVVLLQLNGCLDANVADSGNYTCEVRGRKALVLDKVTHSLRVRGLAVLFSFL